MTDPVFNRSDSERRYRTALGGSLLISVAIHAALFLLWRAAPVEVTPGSAAGRRPPADWRAGGAMEAVHLTSPRRIEIPPPPLARPVPDAPRIQRFDPVEALETTGLVAAVAAPGGRGEAEAGSGAAEGEPGGGAPRLTAPIPRSLVPQWDPPASVKGLRVTVRVHVDAAGRPTGDVELRPPTPDERFNRELVEKVRRMEYHPARRDGAPVPGWAEITFVF